MESLWPGKNFCVVVKGIQVCSLKQSESEEPQPWVQFKCELHTWSALGQVC